MGQIKFSPRFFRTERDNHRYWPFAFWRELFQNSVDARSRNIDISIIPKADSICSVTFSDDGCGMGRDTLDNVYFVLGESTKKGDEIGGHGVARILTCFSHHSYQIESNDVVVNGKGGDFEINSSSKFHHGCKVSIEVDATKRNSSVDMISALKSFLRCSQLACKVNLFYKELDGEPCQEQWSDWGYRCREIIDFGWGKVYVNKSGGHSSTFIARVLGVPMFTKMIRPTAQVVLEIDSTQSRDILIRNRESLHSTYEDEMDQFIQQIAVDKTSALEKYVQKITRQGAGHHVTRRKSKKSIEQIQDPFWQRDISPLVFLNSTEKLSKNIQIMDVLGNTEIKKDFDTLGIICKLESDNLQIRNLFNIHYNLDKINSLTAKRLKILNIWAIILRTVIEEWLELSNSESVSWRPGFILSSLKYKVEGEGTRAEYSKVNGVHEVLLNPLNSENKLAWGLRSKESYSKMIAFAVHEVTHFSYTYHDESYAGFNTALVGRVFLRRNEIFHLISSYLNHGELATV